MVNWKDKKIIELYAKFSEKTASADELKAFNAFLDSDGAEQRLFRLLETDYELSEINTEEISELRAQQIFNYIISQPQERGKVGKLWSRLGGVAAVAAILVVFLFVMKSYLNNNTAQVVSQAQDIPPGVKGATLTLANGRKIILSSSNKTLLAEESGVRISKTADGQITYELTDFPAVARVGKNTLSTDSGQTYQVKLPDGSLVWLNAASSLEYPMSFKNLTHREVKMSGEAYFEIKKDAAHPFIVKTKGQSVTVLGTRFNVKAYAEDASVATTLEEGSVSLAYQAATWGNEGKIHYTDEITLIPGQQSLLIKGTVNISKANMKQNLAWKDGDFVFEQVPIKEVMRDISRWYNISVVYKGTNPSGTFSGNISRTKNISQILKALASTGLVHFKVEGRRVYVTK